MWKKCLALLSLFTVRNAVSCRLFTETACLKKHNAKVENRILYSAKPLHCTACGTKKDTYYLADNDDHDDHEVE